MIFISAILGALGLVAMILKRTLLGVLAGMQLLTLGAGILFALGGATSAAPLTGHSFGLFIAFGSVAQLVVGYALSVRLFYLKKRVGMNELHSMKH